MEKDVQNSNKGRANFTLAPETNAILERLKSETRISKSALIDLAVRLLAESDALEPFKKK